MSFVLAIEPDPKQAATLAQIVRERVGAELVLADSKDAAIAVINERIPDLILLTALLSPRDEFEITDHLRSLEGAGHLQTLTIPVLASGPPKPAASKKKRGLLSAFTGEPAEEPAAPSGCDPSVFAEEIAGYIARAREARSEAERQTRHAKEMLVTMADWHGTPAESVAPAHEAPRASSYWDWDAPAADGSSGSGPAADSAQLQPHDDAWHERARLARERFENAPPVEELEARRPRELDEVDEFRVDPATQLLALPPAPDEPAPGHAFDALDEAADASSATLPDAPEVIHDEPALVVEPAGEPPTEADAEPQFVLERFGEIAPLVEQEQIVEVEAARDATGGARLDDEAPAVEAEAQEVRSEFVAAPVPAEPAPDLPVVPEPSATEADALGAASIWRVEPEADAAPEDPYAHWSGSNEAAPEAELTATATASPPERVAREFDEAELKFGPTGDDEEAGARDITLDDLLERDPDDDDDEAEPSVYTLATDAVDLGEFGVLELTPVVPDAAAFDASAGAAGAPEPVPAFELGELDAIEALDVTPVETEEPPPEPVAPDDGAAFNGEPDAEMAFPPNVEAAQEIPAFEAAPETHVPHEAAAAEPEPLVAEASLADTVGQAADAADEARADSAPPAAGPPTQDGRPARWDYRDWLGSSVGKWFGSTPQRKPPVETPAGPPQAAAPAESPAPAAPAAKVSSLDDFVRTVLVPKRTPKKKRAVEPPPEVQAAPDPPAAPADVAPALRVDEPRSTTVPEPAETPIAGVEPVVALAEPSPAEPVAAESVVAEPIVAEAPAPSPEPAVVAGVPAAPEPAIVVDPPAEPLTEPVAIETSTLVLDDVVLVVDPPLAAAPARAADAGDEDEEPRRQKRRAKRRDEDEEEERPRRKKRRPARRPADPARSGGEEWLASAMGTMRLDLERVRAERMKAEAALAEARAAQARAELAAAEAKARSRSAPPAPAPKKAVVVKRRNPVRARETGEDGRPLQDEWGLFDPDRCGFGALFAKLEESAVEEPPPDEPTAADMLMASNGRRKERRPAAPKPMALWAHRAAEAAAEAGAAEPVVSDEFHALMARLTIPRAVAAVGYATGCRIRRVRVQPVARSKRRPGKDAPVVILSRRLLAAVRAGEAAAPPLA